MILFRKCYRSIIIQLVQSFIPCIYTKFCTSEYYSTFLLVRKKTCLMHCHLPHNALESAALRFGLLRLTEVIMIPD